MTATNSTVKNETEKSSSNSSENQVKKIVVRRLPPSLTKEQFLDIVQPLPDYDYFNYCNADMSLGLNAFCRAYICFKNHQDVFNFRDRFDNYVFVDSKSNEYPALVEYAPYQRRFKLDTQNLPKKDSKCNTIDQDSDYLKFLEQFDKPSGEQLPSCEAILEELEQKEKEKMNLGLLSGSQAAFSAPKIMTPLLEYMRKKREDKKSSWDQKDRDRDRDRDHRSNRRRDRDDDKRYGSGYSNKRRDDHYYGSNYQSSRDYNKSSSSQKTNQSQSKSTPVKQEPKPDTAGTIKILNKPQQSTNTTSSSEPKKETSNLKNSNNNNNIQTNSSNKDNRQNSASASSSTSNSYKNNSNYNNYNRTNSYNNSYNRNSGGGGGSMQKEKNSVQNQVSNANKPVEFKPQKEVDKDQNQQKSNSASSSGQVKNKDRPSIQIYNPAQRAAMRQQKQN